MFDDTLSQIAIAKKDRSDRFNFNNYRRWKRFVSRSTPIAFLLTFATIANAQPPENWTVETRNDGSKVYTDPKSQTQIAVQDAAAENTMNARSFLAEFASRFSSPSNPVCEGLDSSTILQNGEVFFVQTVNDFATCSISAVDEENGVRVALAIEPQGANVGSVDIARSLLVAGENSIAESTAPKNDGRQTETVLGVEELKTALDAVPAARRPIAVVSRSSTSFLGGIPVPSFSQWMVFDNGYGTDCYSWNPLTTAPTPEALPSKCDVARWRKVGELYQFQDEDGMWEEPEDYGVLLSFEPGERIGVDLVSKSGAGGEAVGNVAVSSLSSGSLKMTETGEIQVENSTSVVISGSNVGGGSSKSKTPLMGRYYLDGYLIAIADADGNVSRGFIAGDREESGFYIYLNGDLYWERDE